jgi:predicted PurR-regulated permease PerM
MLKDYLIEMVPSVANQVKKMMFFLFSIPIYIFFMLLYRDNLKAFYYSCLKSESRKSATGLLKEVESTYQDYLKGLILVLFIVTILTTVGLYFIGIQNAIFLGVLSGILTLIPYFGVVLSALIPVLIAVLTKDSIWYPISVLALYAVIQFVEGNLITPKIVGDKVDINPLMIILGVMIFGVIAGVFGMILTIPLLALLKIVASHNPNWKPLHLLLESRNNG